MPAPERAEAKSGAGGEGEGVRKRGDSWGQRDPDLVSVKAKRSEISAHPIPLLVPPRLMSRLWPVRVHLQIQLELRVAAR